MARLFFSIISLGLLSVPFHFHLSSFNPYVASKGMATAVPAQDFDVYINHEEHRLYIDFDDCLSLIEEVKVRDKGGKTIYSDFVADLPVDSIYELNTAEFDPGNYTIVLRSITGELSSDVSIGSKP